MNFVFEKSFQRIFTFAVQSSFQSRKLTFQNSLFLHLTPTLSAEPLKKKKRLDPVVLKQREERKRKKLEKHIRKLEKNAKQLKAIEECEVPVELMKDEKKRIRTPINTTREETIQKEIIIRNWSIYRSGQILKDCLMMDRILHSQQKAMQELKLVSPELYQAALQVVVSQRMKNPVETLPIPNYESPDGDYVDTSKKWDLIRFSPLQSSN